MDDKLEIIEGMLFLAGDDGLDAKQISKILEVNLATTQRMLDELDEYYSTKEVKGIHIANFGGKYKLTTNPVHFSYYQKMIEQTSASLSNAALETLAIIAYNQPITRTKIEDIRGVGCDSMIRKLLAKALIKEDGREQSAGMPILYTVTSEFMDTFGLMSLNELPELGDVIDSKENEELFSTRYRDDEVLSTIEVDVNDETI